MNQVIKRKVLFLCVHNSSRSIMAEAIVNHFLGERWQAYSAGNEPTAVNPLAIQALQELGIDAKTAKSKHINTFLNDQFDCVFTLCDEASESCPVWLGNTRLEHISFADPAAAKGTIEERLNIFRTIRDQIKEIILPMLSN